ncbi:Uncharacterised protein [Paenibacillus macerans]|uniref:Uncharacterized protein n=1 Tax=Paenibacillus macerans TaxID=44252 RepID=A0A090Z4Z6_PAEMA|nr:hypothetical protein DJ90_171 [Paenibacillus macerans]SUA85393.1 Uncharacterised protein [Paenibacillus macerans]
MGQGGRFTVDKAGGSHTSQPESFSAIIFVMAC